jgi:hypothetical protein
MNWTIASAGTNRNVIPAGVSNGGRAMLRSPITMESSRR